MNKSNSFGTSGLGDSKVVFNFSSLEKIASPRPGVLEMESTEDHAEDSIGYSQHVDQTLLPEMEKKPITKGKIAEGAFRSTSDKSSRDKVQVHKTDAQAKGILQDNPSQIDIKLKAEAIEIFIRTLRINTDLLDGTHKNNNYDYFLELLLLDDKESTVKHLLSSKETTSNVAIHCIPHFFFHEYVFHNKKSIEYVFNKLMVLNSKKNKKLKSHVEKQLRKFAGLVRMDDTYHGIPIYFYVRYFKKDDVFTAILHPKILEMIPITDTGISATDYLSFKTALRQAHVPFIPDVDEDGYSEAPNSVEAEHSDDSEETVNLQQLHKKSERTDQDKQSEYQEDLPPEMVVTLYSLCRISDLQQILESYIDLWYDEEFKKQLKCSTDSFAKKREAIVSTVAKFEDSRFQRLNECRSFLNDMSNTNELSTALNLVEYRLQKIRCFRKSRLQDILQSKVLAIRKEEFFQLHEGRLVIHNAMFPNLPYITEVREALTEENNNKQLELKRLKGENGGLEHQKKELLAENQSLKDDNQRKQERIKILESDNQDHLETIETLQDDLQRKQERIESLESENQALQETIRKLQGSGNSPRFFGRKGNGRGGEVIQVQSDSEKDETSSENDGQYVFYDTTQTDNM